MSIPDSSTIERGAASADRQARRSKRGAASLARRRMGGQRAAGSRRAGGLERIQEEFKAPVARQIRCPWRHGSPGGAPTSRRRPEGRVHGRSVRAAAGRPQTRPTGHPRCSSGRRRVRNYWGRRNAVPETRLLDRANMLRLTRADGSWSAACAPWARTRVDEARRLPDGPQRDKDFVTDDAAPREAGGMPRSYEGTDRATARSSGPRRRTTCLGAHSIRAWPRSTLRRPKRSSGDFVAAGTRSELDRYDMLAKARATPVRVLS